MLNKVADQIGSILLFVRSLDLAQVTVNFLEIFLVLRGCGLLLLVVTEDARTHLLQIAS
jgi:hypothetical protein